MLFKLALAQIGLYLFFVPILRVLVEQKDFSDYDFLLATLAIVAVFVGAALGGKCKRQNVGVPSRLKLNNFGVIIWILWSFVYCSISIQLGLFNRRVGSEVAAEMFASFPVWILIIFRVYEILLPVVISLIFIERSRRFAPWVAFFFSIAAFALGGAMYSRAAVAWLVMLIVVFVQNIFTYNQIRMFFIRAIIFSVIGAAIVTLQRASFQQTTLDSDFYNREFLERLDGLEVVSKLSNASGTFNLGVGPEAILVPMLASLSFLPGAVELKGAGVTTVKAVILTRYFDVNQLDINSFFILDTFYTGGWVFVVVAFLIVGALSRLIDSRIDFQNKSILTSLTLAAAMNLLILEREFVGMIIGTLRDFFIFYIFFQLMSAKHLIKHPLQKHRK